MWIRIRMHMYADPNPEVAQRSNILRAVVPFVKFQPVQFILSVLSIHSAHKGLRHVTELNASCAANCLTAPPPMPDRSLLYPPSAPVMVSCRGFFLCFMPKYSKLNGVNCAAISLIVVARKALSVVHP